MHPSDPTSGGPSARRLSRRAAASASATYAVLLSGQGVYLPFFPVWLAHRGFEAREIGFLLAIPTLMRALASAPLTRIGDGALGPRRTFLLTTTGAALGYAALPLMPDVWTLALMLGLMSACLAPTAPLLDVIVLAGVKAHGHDYGRIRQWGSLFWLLTSLAAGKALSVLPVETIPPIIAALAALTVLFGLALPNDRRGGRAAAGAASAAGAAPTARHFALFAAGVATLQGAHAFLYTFATLIWRDAGFSSVDIGALWAVGVVTETALFLLAGNWAGRLGPTRTIAVGAAAALLRWTAMGLEPTSGWLIGALQALHGLTFAAVHLGTMGWLARFERGRAARQGWISSIIGAGLAAGTALAGHLYAAFGAHGYFVMTGVTAAGMALVVAAAAVERRPGQPQSAGGAG